MTDRALCFFTDYLIRFYWLIHRMDFYRMLARLNAIGSPKSATVNVARIVYLYAGPGYITNSAREGA
jgi:hypothetical protein